MMKNSLKTLASILLISQSFASQAISMDATSFRETIEGVISLYDSELPANRNIDISWESETLNASVGLGKNGVTNFSFHGGFARENNLNQDAYAVVVCHEVGHIVGGYPKVMPTQKYTSEAQSDYFAANDCLKKFFASKPINLAQIDLSNIDEKKIADCREDQLCLRGLAAIRDVSVIYPGSSINAKENKVAEFTNFNSYPSNQCRVDTLVAGLMRHPRPTCWFKGYQKDRYEYEPEYEYEEAQIVAEITTITPTFYGCHLTTKYPEYWRTGYFSSLTESDLMTIGATMVGDCSKYKVGGTLSGVLTLFKKALYLNIEARDM